MFLMLFEEDEAHWNHFLMVKTGNHMFRTVYYFANERCGGRDAVLWRLIHAKNPDLQTMYTSVVNVYFFFKYSHVNMLIRIVGC